MDLELPNDFKEFLKLLSEKQVKYPADLENLP
jgi:hypothetical protein